MSSISSDRAQTEPPYIPRSLEGFNGSDEAVVSSPLPHLTPSSPPQRYIITLNLSPRILATFPRNLVNPDAETNHFAPETDPASESDDSEEHRAYFQSLLPEHLRGGESEFESDSATAALLQTSSPENASNVIVEGVEDLDEEEFMRQLIEEQLGQSRTAEEFVEFDIHGMNMDMDMNFDWEDFLPPIPPAPVLSHAVPATSFSPFLPIAPPPQAFVEDRFQSIYSHRFVASSVPMVSSVPTQDPEPMWMVIVDAEGTSRPESQYQEQAVLPIQNIRYHGPPPPPPPVALSSPEMRPEFSYGEAHAQQVQIPPFLTLFNNGTWASYLRQVTHRPGDRVRLTGFDDQGGTVHVLGRVTRAGFQNGVEWTEWEGEIGVIYRCLAREVQGMGRWRG